MLQKKDKGKILFFRKSVFRIAELIFNKPTDVFHLRLLVKETGFSTTAVTQAIDELQQFSIVSVEKTPITTNIKANLESEAYTFYKLVFNLYRSKRYLVVDKLVDLFKKPIAIVLFGSFAKGEDVEASDIDILILTPNKKTPEVDKFISVCEKEFNRHINLMIMPSLEKSDPAFRNSIANGIVLYGYVKVV